MKKQQTKKINKGKNRWAWIAVTVLVVTLLGSVVHHHLQTSGQNRTFKETQSWLQLVMDRVATDVTGGKRVSEDYCHRSSVKYGQGERYCVVDENILYTIGSVTPNDIVVKVQNAIAKYTNINMDNKGANPNTNILASYLFTYNGFGCSVEYYYLHNQSSFSHSAEINTFTNGLRVSLSCSGPAMADYFPNRD